MARENVRDFDDAWRKLAPTIGHALGSSLFHEIRKSWVEYQGALQPSKFILELWDSSLNDTERDCRYDEEVDHDGTYETPDEFMRKFNRNLTNEIVNEQQRDF